MSEKILLFGYSLMALQVIFAWHDGYATQRQLHARGITNAYSLMEHGGFWSDIFIVIPSAAYIAHRYQLAYASWWSMLIFSIALVVTVIAGLVYNKVGKIIPVPYAHDGKTPPAGWIHGIFAVAALWIMGMFYLTPTNPPVSPRDLLAISILFTPFSFLGIVDFNRRWIFYPKAKIQVVVSIAIIWIVTTIRLIWR